MSTDRVITEVVTVSAELVVTAIAQTAVETLLAVQINESRGSDGVAAIRDAVTCSPYWTQFCLLAAAGEVPPGFIAMPALATAVVCWARTEA